MATIKLGAMVTEMRGSVGGTIFSRNGNGSYAKNFTKPVNPNVGAQQSIRSVFSNISQNWRALTDEEREAWVQAAPNFPYTNRVGEQSTYTGSQFFNKINGSRLQLVPSAGILTSPPLPATLTAISSLTVIMINDAGVLELSMEVNGGDPIGAGEQVVVSTTGVVSQGLYRPKPSAFRAMGMFSVNASGEVDGPTFTNLVAAFTSQYGVPAVGQAVWFRIETVEPSTGLRIVGTQVKVTVAAAA